MHLRRTGGDVPVQEVTEIPLSAALDGRGDAVLAQAATEPSSPSALLPAQLAHSNGPDILTIGGWIVLLMCLVMIIRRLNWINDTVDEMSDSVDAQRAEIGKFGRIENSIRMLFGNVEMKQQETPINQTGTAQGSITAPVSPPVTPPELEASAANGLAATQPASAAASEHASAAAAEHSPQNRYSHEAGINELVDIERLTRGCLESTTLRRAQVKIWKYTPGPQDASRTTYEQRTQALHASAKRTSYTSFNNNRI